jgi:hypothetical protein
MSRPYSDISMSETGPVSAAVVATLAALDLPDTDRGLAAIVVAYAGEIDAAGKRMERLDRLLSKISRYEEPDAYEALTTLRGMLSSRATLDRLGARLQTGLDQLRATPRARPVQPPRAPAGSPLGVLRLAASGAGMAAEDGPP